RNVTTAPQWGERTCSVRAAWSIESWVKRIIAVKPSRGHAASRRGLAVGLCCYDKWFSPHDVQQVDRRRPVEELLIRRRRQSDHDRTPAEHEKLGVPDVEARTVGQVQPERGERPAIHLLGQVIEGHRVPPT